MYLKTVEPIQFPHQRYHALTFKRHESTQNTDRRGNDRQKSIRKICLCNHTNTHICKRINYICTNVVIRYIIFAPKYVLFWKTQVCEDCLLYIKVWFSGCAYIPFGWSEIIQISRQGWSTLRDLIKQCL